MRKTLLGCFSPERMEDFVVGEVARSLRLILPLPANKLVGVHEPRRAPK